MEDTSEPSIISLMMPQVQQQIQQSEQDKFNFVKKTARDRSIYLNVLKYYNSIPAEELCSLPEFVKMMQTIKDKEDSKPLRSQNVYAMFITLNPDNKTVKFEELKDKVEGFIKRKYVRDQDYIYAFEQRSEEVGKYEGYHCHILFVRPLDEAVSYYEREIRKYFNSICPARWCDIRRISRGDYDKTEGYIRGIKADISKSGKSICDVRWRESLGLLPYYCSEVTNDDEEEQSDDEYDDERSDSDDIEDSEPESE